MNRRQFLRGLMSVPALAVPSVTISAVALHESGQAYKRIDQAIKGDNVIITNCNFELNGGLSINGDKAHMSYCNIAHTGNVGMTIGKH